MPVAGDGDRVVPIETLNVFKVYTVLYQVELIFGIIPFVCHSISKAVNPSP